MTEMEFIRREISIWGEDEIEYLINQGYTPILTGRGWRWILSRPALPAVPDLTTAAPRATMRSHRGTPVPR